MIDKSESIISDVLTKISKKFDINEEDIKTRYEEMLRRDVIQNLAVSSEFERKQHATRLVDYELIMESNCGEIGDEQWVI